MLSEINKTFVFYSLFDYTKKLYETENFSIQNRHSA